MNHGKCKNCIWYNNYSLCTPEEKTERRRNCPDGSAYCGMWFNYVRPEGWCPDYNYNRKKPKELWLAIG